MGISIDYLLKTCNIIYIGKKEVTIMNRIPELRKERGISMKQAAEQLEGVLDKVLADSKK